MSIDKIEAELEQIDRTSGGFARTRLLVIIARLLLILVKDGSVL